MKIKQAKQCDTCGLPIGWLPGDKIPRNLDGTPHVCPEEHTSDPLPQNTDDPLPKNTATSEYFAATVGRRRYAKFNRDLYEAGTLLRKLGFFDDEDWCVKVQEATMRLDEEVRLVAWLRVSKALLMAMNLDGYESRASEALKAWTEWWPMT